MKILSTCVGYWKQASVAYLIEVDVVIGGGVGVGGVVGGGGVVVDSEIISNVLLKIYLNLLRNWTDLSWSILHEVVI